MIDPRNLDGSPLLIHEKKLGLNEDNMGLFFHQGTHITQITPLEIENYGLWWVIPIYHQKWVKETGKIGSARVAQIMTYF